MATTRYDLYPNLDQAEAMRLYIEHGIDPGRFLRCVLKNDLIGSAEMADMHNQRLLHYIATWLVSYAPRACFGSPAAFDSWVAQHGLKGS